MYKSIYKQIKKYENIVIARHIKVDPDAMASQTALKKTIELTFPNKKVYEIGTGTVRFNYIGHMDKIPEGLDDCLLISVDTPDLKRLDLGDFKNYTYSIKIDHHPFIEKYCDIELIDEEKSSASEMIYDLIKNTPLKMNKEIAEIIFLGIASDTERFLFSNTTSDTFYCIGDLIKAYNFDITELYAKLYRRPLNEIRLKGYMAMNMKVTENGVGYIKITDEIMNKYDIDSASSGGAINEFNNIDELLVWLSATEDTRNGCIRVSIRSRGPEINKIAEKYNGGGHKLASGARLVSFEEVEYLIKDLDKACENYIKESEVYEN